MTKTIVMALGGNAILSDDPTAEAQQEALRKTVAHIIPLIEKGFRLVITHGNGPQVGNLLLQQAAGDSESNPALPLDTCVAMTQGSIGYWLEQALRNELMKHDIKNEVATLVTQVVVDEHDKAFYTPTKPIGPFYKKEEADELSAQEESHYVEDAGRGWRKVVASPKPMDIVGHSVISQLLHHDVIVIAGGGGGVPVNHYPLRGLEAVIDKDFASEKLAELIEADIFIVLTGVANVAIGYGTDNQKELETVTIKELEDYKKAGEFAPGSMLPKVEAVIDFVTSGPDKKAMITSLEKLADFTVDGVGTTVIP